MPGQHTPGPPLSPAHAALHADSWQGCRSSVCDWHLVDTEVSVQAAWAFDPDPTPCHCPQPKPHGQQENSQHPPQLILQAPVHLLHPCTDCFAPAATDCRLCTNSTAVLRLFKTTGDPTHSPHRHHCTRWRNFNQWPAALHNGQMALADTPITQQGGYTLPVATHGSYAPACLQTASALLSQAEVQYPC